MEESGDSSDIVSSSWEEKSCETVKEYIKLIKHFYFHNHYMTGY